MSNDNYSRRERDKRIKEVQDSHISDGMKRKFEKSLSKDKWKKMPWLTDKRIAEQK